MADATVAHTNAHPLLGTVDHRPTSIHTGHQPPADQKPASAPPPKAPTKHVGRFANTHA
jgi:hypothetical protein